jgi:hypothetical protein
VDNDALKSIVPRSVLEFAAESFRWLAALAKI